MQAQLGDRRLMLQTMQGACSKIFCTGKLGLTISHLSDLPNQNSKHLEGCHLPDAVGDSDLYSSWETLFYLGFCFTLATHPHLHYTLRAHHLIRQPAWHPCSQEVTSFMSFTSFPRFAVLLPKYPQATFILHVAIPGASAGS